MLIWKEKLPANSLDPLKIDLPFDSVETVKRHILKIETIYGEPIMWYQADDDTDGKVRKENTFVIQGIWTGSYTDEPSREVINMQSYIGSATLLGGCMTLHYFVMTEEGYNRL